ncbi:MAG TPA: hypothetical protein VJ866_21115 [Pyrinomonadaceae bacterium]|nr:hypothetical protein [Pyrinomonadaceae bacterium]
MSEQQKVIRDFIYVDQARLYSFYSQLNKGVAQQVFQSYLHGESASISQTSPDVSDEVSESERTRVSQRTESTILYDYMYEQLEEKMRGAILDVSRIFPDRGIDEELDTEEVLHYLNTISNALMIKVTGPAEIEDYRRIDAILEKGNNLMESAALFSLLSAENLKLIASLEKQAEAEKDRNKKAQIKDRIKRLKDPRLHARDLNILDEPKVIEGIRLFIEIFYPNNFEIAVSSTNQLFVTYRGIVDKKWLRIEPEILRSLYGGKIESNWTMVGQVTSTSAFKAEYFDKINKWLEEQLPKTQSLRDPLRYIFNRVRGLEANLNQSGLRFEPIVCPLAIYREQIIVKADLGN